MKVYCPLNLSWRRGGPVFGWIDGDSDDVFICSYGQESDRSEMFSSIGMQKCIPLGRCSNSASQEHFSFPLSTGEFIHLNHLKNAEKTSLVIFFQIYPEFAASGDFGGIFSTIPLKYIKWTSIVNLNKDGRFLQLSPMQRFVSNLSSRFLSFSLVKRASSLSDNLSLRDWSKQSATLRQFFFKRDAFAAMYRFLLQSKGNVSEASRLEYRNTLILILIDFILGSLFGLLFSLFAQPVYSHTERIVNYACNGFFEEYLDWFMGWPAGFKFNANLTRFVGRFFLVLLRLWRAAVWNPIDLNRTLALVAFAKHFGLSMIIALAIDFWKLATIHISLFYRLIRVIQRAYFTWLLALFRLFQGRKWNVLRKRVDYTQYSMDQLLVGMLLFSILLCTWPTVSAYYLLFTASLLAVWTVECVADSLSILLNRFPVYSLMIKDSATLTSGIKLKPLKLTTPPSFLLQLEPEPPSALLKPFLSVLLSRWQRLFNVHNAVQLLTAKELEK